MRKCLFLLCPTDCLEPIINNRFKYENYFYTSLGNSFIYDRETIKHIKETVKTHNIREIYFILCCNNQIFLDALGNQNFYDTRGLNSFCEEISIQKEFAEEVCHTDNLQFSVLSFYLNKKIKKLYQELGSTLNYSIDIRGKIYDRHNNIFRAIHSNLVCLEKHHLN